MFRGEIPFALVAVIERQHVPALQPRCHLLEPVQRAQVDLGAVALHQIQRQPAQPCCQARLGQRPELLGEFRGDIDLPPFTVLDLDPVDRQGVEELVGKYAPDHRVGHHRVAGFNHAVGQAGGGGQNILPQ